MRSEAGDQYLRRQFLLASIPRAHEARGWSTDDFIAWYWEHHEQPIANLTIRQLEDIYLFFGGTVQRPLFNQQSTGGR